MPLWPPVHVEASPHILTRLMGHRKKPTEVSGLRVQKEGSMEEGSGWGGPGRTLISHILFPQEG